ncbi:MAG: S8 family peptidase, partial [Pseudomonadota bacterium]
VGQPMRARLAARARSAGLDGFGPGVRLAGQRAGAIRDPERRAQYRTRTAIKALSQDPGVAYAQPNYRYTAQAEPNDPFYALQWHYPLIDLPAAWDLTTGDPDVTVAVLDTGVLVDHPDLAGQLVPGYDFISDPATAADGDGIDADPADPGDGDGTQPSSFHGTHVAGTVAAVSGNESGIAGVAPGVRLMPLRVLGMGGGTSYDIIQAIRYAAGLPNDSGETTEPVDVMNLSLGRLGTCSPAEQAAFTAARQAGVMVVGAAGNDGVDAAEATPASCADVMAVGAVDLVGERSFYSNFGSAVDVLAPGGDDRADDNGDGYPDGVLSLMGDERSDPPDYVYTFMTGTSMASPHVAGVVALMKSVHPELTPDAIDQLLADGEMTDERGIINAFSSVYAALNALGQPPELNPELAVQPESLNFGTAFNLAVIDVRVSGGGTLTAQPPRADVPWLSISPVTERVDGTGRYRVTVDRSGLPPGTHTATIRIDSDRNAVEVPVIMQVSEAAVDADAGHLYVLLVDRDSGEVVAVTEADADGGLYAYELTGVPRGEYEVVAGSDFDADEVICDGGESCGAFPTLDQRRTVVVDRDRSGVDFTVGHVIPISGTVDAGGSLSGTAVERGDDARQPAARRAR